MPLLLTMCRFRSNRLLRFSGFLAVACLWAAFSFAAASYDETSPVPPDARRQVVDLIYRTLDLQGGTSEIKAEAIPLHPKIGDIQAAMRNLNARKRGTEIVVELPSDVLFDFDKFNIRPDAAKALAQVAILIRGDGSCHVRIEGHTDAVGSEAYNQKLSERRAQSVRDFLVKHYGFRSSCFATIGYGEKRPIASNSTPQGRQKNRRVEIRIRS